MEFSDVEDAVELLEKANAELEPELLSGPAARKLLEVYARVVRLGNYGVAALSRKVHDPVEVARATGTSLGRAKAVAATGEAMRASDELDAALQGGEVSLDQAAEIASALESAPGAAEELVAAAKKEPFHVLIDKARQAALDPPHPGRGRPRLGAGRAAPLRRGLVHGLRQPLPHRVRPPATPGRARALFQRQPETPLLVVPPGQDRARPARRQAQVPGSVQSRRALTLPRHLRPGQLKLEGNGAFWCVEMMVRPAT